MRSLVIGHRQKAPNFSAFHWSPHDCLITIGQHFVTTRVVHLPKRRKQAKLPNRTKVELITIYCSYARPAQPCPIRARLCGPCIAANAGLLFRIWRFRKDALTRVVARGCGHGPASLSLMETIVIRVETTTR